MIKTKALTMIDEVDQLKIKGLEIIRVTSDGNYDKLRSIILRDADGIEFEFAGADCSHRLEIHIPRPPKKVKRWAIVGSFEGLQIDQLFGTEQEAKDSLERINDHCQEDYNPSLKVEKREIEE